MRRMMLLALLVVTMTTAMPIPTASAGPLLDWWRTRPRLFGKKAEPVTAYLPPVGTCTTSCQQTCQRVSVSYVPQTSYRSTWVQTPITSYRPSTTTDPLTGCQVTCVKPCTTYQWSLRRVPYTTYKPVYKTHTVQMPAVSSCNSCGVAPVVQPTTVVPGAVVPGAAVPYAAAPTSTTITTQPSVGAPMGGVAPGFGGGGAPADLQPTMQPPTTTNRVVVPPAYDVNGNPIGSSILNNGTPNPGTSSGTVEPMSGTIDRMPRRIDTGNPQYNQHSPIVDPSPDSRGAQPNAAPPLLPTDLNTVDVNLRRPWEYSPIQLAAYEQPAYAEPQRLQPQTQFVPSERTPTQRPANQGWRSMSR